MQKKSVCIKFQYIVCNTFDKKRYQAQIATSKEAAVAQLEEAKGGNSLLLVVVVVAVGHLALNGDHAAVHQSAPRDGPHIGDALQAGNQSNSHLGVCQA